MSNKSCLLFLFLLLFEFQAFSQEKNSSYNQQINGTKVSFDMQAIPAGTYSVTLEMSGRFGPDTLTINDVPGFKYIRMHSGNTAKDTEGCPLLGMQATEFSLIGGTSRPAVALVKSEVKKAIERGESVTIQVNNP